MANGRWPDECFTKSRRPSLQQGAEEYADQQLPKHIPERGPHENPLDLLDRVSVPTRLARDLGLRDRVFVDYRQCWIAVRFRH
jgi:hypothetical protein